MFKGNIIESMVVGGPAFNCQQLDRGDELLLVDGEAVTDANRNLLLIGGDVPGSAVTLTVRKTSVYIKRLIPMLSVLSKFVTPELTSMIRARSRM